MMLRAWFRAAVLLAFGLNVQSASANVVGADTQNFNPLTSGLDFVTVHSSETLKPGLLNLGFFINYAVNSLPNYENVSTSSRTNFSDSLFSGDMNFGLGLTDHWDLGMSFPFLISQSVDSDLNSYRGEFAETGLTEFRANTKLRLLGDDSQGAALVGSVNINQIEDNPFTGVNAGPTYNIEIVGDMTLGRYALGANLGYRIRQAGDPLPSLVGVVEPLGDQWIASGAVSYLLQDYDIKLIGEMFASLPAEDSQFASDRDLSSLELLLGLKMDLTPAIAAHLGGGTEVIHGTSSPDWRLYAGLNWVLGPLFSKEDPIVRVRNQSVKQSMEGRSADPYEGNPEPVEAFVARDILFKFNSDEVDDAFTESLRRMIDYLNRGQGFKSLTIIGHTDSIGSEDYNLQLSRRRAASVRGEMVRMGLPGDKVKAAGMGESQPIADNGNYQGRRQNRRVEFRVVR